MMLVLLLMNHYLHVDHIMRSEVLTDEIPKNTPKLREEVQMWLKHKKIQGFYDVLQVSDCHQGNDDDNDTINVDDDL